MCHHTELIFLFLVKMGFHHVGQVSLKPLTSGDHPAMASQSAGITGVSYCAQPVTGIFEPEPGRARGEQNQEEPSTELTYPNSLPFSHPRETSKVIKKLTCHTLTGSMEFCGKSSKNSVSCVEAKASLVGLPCSSLVLRPLDDGRNFMNQSFLRATSLSELDQQSSDAFQALRSHRFGQAQQDGNSGKIKYGWERPKPKPFSKHGPCCSLRAGCLPTSSDPGPQIPSSSSSSQFGITPKTEAVQPWPASVSTVLSCWGPKEELPKAQIQRFGMFNAGARGLHGDDHMASLCPWTPGWGQPGALQWVAVEKGR
ncbi:hypothetical protein AAY473_026978 [Plecturocebus cupreus]